MQAIELEGTSLRDEIGRLREQLEKAKAEKSRLENDLEEAKREIDTVRESERQAISRANETHYQLEAIREDLSMKVENQQKIEELMQEVAELRARNKSKFQSISFVILKNVCNNIIKIIFLFDKVWRNLETNYKLQRLCRQAVNF